MQEEQDCEESEAMLWLPYAQWRKATRVVLETRQPRKALSVITFGLSSNTIGCGAWKV